MKKIETAVLASALLGLAAGCSPIDPAATVYGSPQRVGVTYVGYAPAMEVSDPVLVYWANARGQLGFDSPSGAEVSYGLPLKPGFDLKMAVDIASWDVKFPSGWLPAGDAATWDQKGIKVLLRGGWKWGRFGAHFAAGPGWLLNELDWPGHATETDGSLVLQTELGVSFAIHPSFDLGLDLAYMASRASYVVDGNGKEQILDAAQVKVGLNFMF